MIENIKQLKKERPDLVKDFEKMTHKQLLEQCYLECIDAINMEERVSFFMQECTNNMSKTNYTIDSISALIRQKQEQDIIDFCIDEVNDNETDIEIANCIREMANNSSNT